MTVQGLNGMTKEKMGNSKAAADLQVHLSYQLIEALMTLMLQFNYTLKIFLIHWWEKFLRISVCSVFMHSVRSKGFFLLVFHPWGEIGPSQPLS